MQTLRAGTQLEHAAANRRAAAVRVHAGQHRQRRARLAHADGVAGQIGLHTPAANVVDGVARQRARARHRAAADAKRADRRGKTADVQAAAVDRVRTGRNHRRRGRTGRTGRIRKRRAGNTLAPLLIKRAGVDRQPAGVGARNSNR